MYVQNWEDLQKLSPASGGVWNPSIVYEYLVMHCNMNFTRQIDAFFRNYADDEALADLLFSFLLNEDYDGSDSQMGAARILGQMDRDLLRRKQDLLLLAQSSDVVWKRPFPQDTIPSWL